MISSFELGRPFIASTRSRRIFAACASVQSCKTALRRNTSAFYTGYFSMKSCAWKVIRSACDAFGEESIIFRPLSTLAGRSCTTSLRCGNASASAIAASPVDPPTSTTTPASRMPSHAKPAVRWRSTTVSLLCTLRMDAQKSANLSGLRERWSKNGRLVLKVTLNAVSYDWVELGPYFRAAAAIFWATGAESLHMFVA